MEFFLKWHLYRVVTHILSLILVKWWSATPLHSLDLIIFGSRALPTGNGLRAPAGYSDAEITSNCVYL